MGEAPNNSFIRVMYFNVNTDETRWEEEKFRVLKHILVPSGDENDAAPDIVVLYDVVHFADFLYPCLYQLGYNGVFGVLYPTKKKNSLYNHGIAVFWRRQKNKPKTGIFLL